MKIYIRLVNLTIVSTIFLCVINACSSKTEETVDFNTISNREDAKFEKNKREVDSIVNQKPEKSVFLHTFDSIYPDANWQVWDTLLFVDRFRPISTEKWIVTNEKDSLNLSLFTFKDSIQTKNAFFNWLDCYGVKRISLKIGSPLGVKGRAQQILVSSTNILVIESVKPLNQFKLVKSLNNKVKEINYMYLVDAPSSRKSTWTKMRKNEVFKLNNDDKIR